jgi:ATP-dependent DNA helicase RecG
VKPRRYRNRRLGDFLKELDLSEGKATGIPLIRKALRTNGSPDPVFNTDDDRTFFEVQFLMHPDFEDEFFRNENDKMEQTATKPMILSKNAEAILNHIEENAHITIVELAEEIGITTRAVEKNVAQLKKHNLIERVGFHQSGYWKIVKR